MNIIDILKADYQRFPVDQTYEIYAENVYFKDPMTEFRGIKQYKTMIGLMSRWFQNMQMDLHDITQVGDLIDTQWTLSWTTPLPWKPRIAVSGRSELKLNEKNLICSHIDYWNCSRWNVLQQHFSAKFYKD
ncbi:MAG: DUF2358 domain-containing protein [Snowella sp.]|nr:DUF2358 domain-containing protein [Snowella sp.]